MPSISQGSGKVSRARKGSKVVKAKAPAPTVNELTSQVSLLKKQLGEVQLEAVRCHDLELSTSTLQQEVASLREELARSEERGREERKEHCAAQVATLRVRVRVRVRAATSARSIAWRNCCGNLSPSLSLRLSLSLSLTLTLTLTLSQAQP